MQRLRWFFRPGSAYHLLSLTLMLIALCSVTLTLGSIVRELETGLLMGFTASAVLLGWGLGARRLNSWAANLLVISTGFIGVGVSIGNLAGISLDLLRLLSLQSWNILRIPYHIPDWIPIAELLIEFAKRLFVLLSRIGDWLAAIGSGQPAFDPVAAGWFWAMVIWFIAAWAAWSVARHQRVLVGLLPPLVLLAAATAYTGKNHASLLPLLASMFSLLVLSGQYQRERRWEAEAVDYSEEIRFELGYISLGL